MSAQIHSVRGGPLPSTEEAQAELVQVLTDLLERAKSGEINGLAYGVCRPNGGPEATGWVGGIGTRHSLHTAIAILHHRYVAALGNGAG